MKPTTYLAFLLGLVPLALAQTEDPGPSPTESVGCEPHGDHWHCEGPRSTPDEVATSTVASEVTSQVTSDNQVTSDVASDVSSTVTSAVTTTTSAAGGDDDDHDDDDDDDDDDEDHDAGTGVLPPSPTASVGCEPHGDHWHCEGPASETTATDAPEPDPTEDADATTTTTEEATDTPNAAAHYQGAAGLGLAGLAAAAMLAI